MTFAELDWVAVGLRLMIYVGTVAAAGGVLARLTLGMGEVAGTINRQIVIGVLILVVCEPLRYLNFQIEIAQGDWSLAFDPAMRWMAIQTPLGQAAIVRLIGVAIVVIGLFHHRLAIVGAVVVISSYLLEGHTVSNDNRFLLSALLFLHLAVAHWWLGALVPLWSVLNSADSTAAVDRVEKFGRTAIWAVAALVIAGSITLAVLTDWRFDPTRTYQQGFALKLAAFFAILLLAAVNHLKWTPLLKTDFARARRGLQRSISYEVFVALTVLAATAVAISFAPTAL